MHSIQHAIPSTSAFYFVYFVYLVYLCRTSYCRNAETDIDNRLQQPGKTATTKKLGKTTLYLPAPDRTNAAHSG